MRFSALRIIVILSAIFILASCQPSSTSRNTSGSGGGGTPLTDANTKRVALHSSAFKSDGVIPDKYGCKGANVSPPLSWDKPPDKTKSLALICDDPDAPSGTWTHWLLYGVAPSARELKEGIAAGPAVAGPAVEGLGRQGINDFKNTGYGGPCPPSGTHHYHFTLYAVDREISLPPGATRAELESELKGHVVAVGELIGTYSK